VRVQHAGPGAARHQLEERGILCAVVTPTPPALCVRPRARTVRRTGGVRQGIIADISLKPRLKLQYNSHSPHHKRAYGGCVALSKRARMWRKFAPAAGGHLRWDFLAGTGRTDPHLTRCMNWSQSITFVHTIWTSMHWDVLANSRPAIDRAVRGPSLRSSIGLRLQADSVGCRVRLQSYSNSQPTEVPPGERLGWVGYQSKDMAILSRWREVQRAEYPAAWM
jgi:hypothetical protein